MQSPSSSIQITLARSYAVYFVCSIVGLLADSVFQIDIFIPYARFFAPFCFIAGTFLIVWAQYTSRHFNRSKHIQEHMYFHHGPYRLLRNPTHFGLLVLVMGYAIVSSSVLFFLVTLIGYFVSNIFFKKYEQQLEDTIEQYTDYKTTVTKVL